MAGVAEIIHCDFKTGPALRQTALADVFTFEAGIALLHELYAQRLASRYLATGEDGLLQHAHSHLFAASAARRLAGAVPAIVPPAVAGIGVGVYGVAADRMRLKTLVTEAFPGRSFFLCGTDNERFIYNCVIIRPGCGEDYRADWRQARLVSRELARLTGAAVIVGDYLAALRTVSTCEGRAADGLPVAVNIEPFEKFIAFRRGKGYSPGQIVARWERRRLARLRAD